MTVDDLVTWLRAQLDDDEFAAQAAANYSAERGYSFPTDGSGTYGLLDYEHEQHVARHNPARVLAEVDAKRRIIDAYGVSQGAEYPSAYAGGLEEALRHLASAYAGRPGYRDEWAPDA